MSGMSYWHCIFAILKLRGRGSARKPFSIIHQGSYFRLFLTEYCHISDTSDLRKTLKKLNSPYFGPFYSIILFKRNYIVPKNTSFIDFFLDEIQDFQIGQVSDIENFHPKGYKNIQISPQEETCWLPTAVTLLQVEPTWKFSKTSQLGSETSLLNKLAMLYVRLVDCRCWCS